MTPLRLGTRGSQLALWQARAVAARLERAGAGPCEILVIRTTGDRLAEASLAKAGGKRLFVKELEDALLAGAIDAAVHSAKDMPVVLPDGLAIAGVLPREDPRDALILPARPGRRAPPDAAAVLRSLPPAPRVGTSSVRRLAQLRPLLREARFLPIRGNLDTRLRKLDEGEYDLLVLAAAGLRRLQAGPRMSAALPIETCMPAPGQGVIAVEARAADARLRAVLAGIDDPATQAALTAERALVHALGGGCQTPIGALARPADAGSIELQALVTSPDGGRVLRRSAAAPAADAAALGARVAALLDADGAQAILDAVRAAQAPVEGSP